MFSHNYLVNETLSNFSSKFGCYVSDFSVIRNIWVILLQYIIVLLAIFFKITHVSIKTTSKNEDLKLR